MPFHHNVDYVMWIMNLEETQISLHVMIQLPEAPDSLNVDCFVQKYQTFFIKILSD
jgi:hypothetical protein